MAGELEGEPRSQWLESKYFGGEIGFEPVLVDELLPRAHEEPGHFSAGKVERFVDQRLEIGREIDRAQR